MPATREIMTAFEEVKNYVLYLYVKEGKTVAKTETKHLIKQEIVHFGKFVTINWIRRAGNTPYKIPIGKADVIPIIDDSK